MSPADSSGLLVDRLAWEGKAGPPISFAVGVDERVYVCGEGGGSLLLAVGGFLPALSGQVICEGRDLGGVPAASRHVAYIPRGDSLVAGRSLRGNVMLAGADRATAAACLANVGLRDGVDRPAAGLSSSQRRLAALARALTAQPALLLVDEAPDDPPAIPDQLATLRRPPALVATPSAALALARAERILLLNGGQVAQFGAPRDVYERPADRFAAIWSGACNLISVFLDGAGPVPGSVRARLGEHVVPARFRDRISGSAVLAVRPHRVRVEPDGVPALVHAVDYGGATTRVTLALAGTTLCLDTPSDGLVPGGTVRISWHWSDAWPVS